MYKYIISLYENSTFFLKNFLFYFDFKYRLIINHRYKVNFKIGKTFTLFFRKYVWESEGFTILKSDHQKSDNIVGVKGLN